MILRICSMDCKSGDKPGTKTRTVFGPPAAQGHRICNQSKTHLPCLKLQALVYDILPSTTAIFSYATGSRKLSANKQFFAGAQTVVSLLQTTEIISDVCFITDYVAYTSSNKPKSFKLRQNFFVTRGGCISCLRACLGAKLLPQS